MAVRIWRSYIGRIALGALAVCMMIAASVLLRQGGFERATGAENLEAPFHVLLTVRALGESSGSVHRWLPTVSLGGERNKHIPWGASIPTSAGEYIYTSFPPAGFVVPYLVFKAVGADANLRNLAYFNAFLGGLSALLIYGLIIRVISAHDRDDVWMPAVAVLATSIALFSSESLRAHGLIYWSQSLYQPVLILTLYCVYGLLTRRESELHLPIALLLLVLLGPMIEWTGYIFNAGLVAALWLSRGPGYRRVAVYVMGITAVAVLLTIAHYALAAGLSTAIDAFLGRFRVRSAVAGSLTELIHGYIRSFGLYLPLLVAAPFLVVETKNERFGAWRRYTKPSWMLFALACFPVVENLVLLQHATAFSFDRLKLGIPAALLLAMSLSIMDRWRRALIVLGLIASGLYGVNAYQSGLRDYSAWAQIDADNRRFARLVADHARECTVMLSNVKVRGYANLLFERGVYEQQKLVDAESLMKTTNACNAVFVEGTLMYPDLPRYLYASLIEPDGSVRRIVDITGQSSP